MIRVLTDAKQINWMRCARTDKGVHAAGNLLSLKMQIPGDYDVIERANSFLPEQIRIWGNQRKKKTISLVELIFLDRLCSRHRFLSCKDIM